MNARFWFTAGVLTGVAASAVVYLALRSPAALDRTSVTAEATHPVGTDGPPPASKAMSMEEATARLETRLERNGGSRDDWELLAKSYEFLRRPADAARAREHGGMPSTTEVAQLASMADAIAQPRANGSEAAAVAVTAEIAGTVSIENHLANRVDRNATLFIYAKAADSAGPPLAVLRLNAKSWPVSFRLDDSMAMLPSRRLSQFQKVVVEARISRSGRATPAAGDFYVTSDAISPGSGQKLALVINHEIG